mgnify:CR=1 FL=1
MTLGQRIQKLRKQHNLSQEALGEKLGVSRQAISRWEMDGAVPEVDKLIAMSKLFGISLDELLGLKAPVPNRPKLPWSRQRRMVSAALVALLLLCALPSLLLWRENQSLRRQIAASSAAFEPYVPCDGRRLFQDWDVSFGDISMGFPQARGTEDLTVQFSFQPAEGLKGWKVTGLEAKIEGYDPWGEYPDGTEVPKDKRQWERIEYLPVKTPLFGDSHATLTLPDYGGESITVTAVELCETDTGRTATIENFLTIGTDAQRGNNFTVNTLSIQEQYVPCVADLPLSVARQIPGCQLELS